MSVLQGNGDGTFQHFEYYDVGEIPTAIAIDDLNGDSAPDLAVAKSQRDSVSVLLNSGENFCHLAKKFDVAAIANGVVFYTDRNYYVSEGVPAWMEGRMLIKTPNDERFNDTGSGYLRFKTPVSWWVYVLFDSRSSCVPAWLNGWEQRPQYRIYSTLETQPYLKVYCKWFEAGACVDLGGNYGAGASYEYRSNYSVVYGK